MKLYRKQIVIHVRWRLITKQLWTKRVSTCKIRIMNENSSHNQAEQVICVSIVRNDTVQTTSNVAMRVNCIRVATRVNCFWLTVCWAGIAGAALPNPTVTNRVNKDNSTTSGFYSSHTKIVIHNTRQLLLLTRQKIRSRVARGRVTESVEFRHFLAGTKRTNCE